ncbi:hypothetical protein DFH09DRAFT_1085514 [Mycena vulgaris]|nr:hypothetical protein DFH09DRAFT_1085514 [Mycena vulgaris]
MAHFLYPSLCCQLVPGVEDVEMQICTCYPAAVQIVRYGTFPCAPVLPSLAVDLRVLDFTMNLFLQIAPNNMVLSVPLERCLGSMGFQLEHKNSLRRRFGNCLMWYIHLRQQTKEHYSKLVEAARNIHLGMGQPEKEEEEAVAPAPQDKDNRDPWWSLPGRETTPPTTPVNSADPPLPTSRRRQRHRRWYGQSGLSMSPVTPTPGSPAAGRRKRARETTPEVPFLDPLPRTRPSDYLRCRCPACFGNLKHDALMIADINKKSPCDPPRTHPKTHFVSKEDSAQTEAYVDSVRNTGSKQPEKRKKAMLDALEEMEDGYEPGLLLPRSRMKKREKASTMGLLCSHDRVLWLVNMHSAGEKQFNVVILMETLFQHLPLDIWVGLLYDVARAFEHGCRKWIDRLAFAVSVFHVFGHEWACQLLYHPQKRIGFGFSNGEGCERFWHLISHLIANLCISGYHNQLCTLDMQIEHADDASLTCLGEWIRCQHLHSVKKRLEAQDVLRESGQSTALLRTQWALQVATQTKPLPCHLKNKGQEAVNGVILLCVVVKTRKAQLAQLRESFLEAVAEEDPDAAVYQMQLDAASEGFQKAQESLRQKEAALGVTQRQSLKDLSTSEYIRLRMNARALKRRLRDRLRARKFELDKVECSFRRLVNESAVKRREPTISKVNSDYNKLCGEISKVIKEGKAPRGAIAPVPIPAKGIWQLDVDDGIWQDVGLDEDDGEPAVELPPWLCDERVRSGIKAMLELDRCNKEDVRLKKERCALQVWFAEEWAVVKVAMERADSKEDKYQLQLIRDNLHGVPQRPSYQLVLLTHIYLLVGKTGISAKVVRMKMRAGERKAEGKLRILVPWMR